jgi:hypothetical protein
MPLLRDKYRRCLENHDYKVSLVTAFIFFIFAAIFTLLAIVYATERASGPVTDIILSNIPTFDVDGIFIYGPFLFWAIVAAYLLFREPKRIPFLLEGVATFEVIRSFFISLTHIGPFPTHIPIDINGLLGVFTNGNDLFFSGHTGLPFLVALIFWENKPLRFFSITSSIFFGIVVLLAHLHYSIDVFAAFFITYTIFVITKKLFPKDSQNFGL